MSKNVKQSATKEVVPMSLEQQNEFDLRHGVGSGWYRVQDVHKLFTEKAELAALLKQERDDHAATQRALEQAAEDLQNAEAAQAEVQARIATLAESVKCTCANCADSPA